MFLMTFLSMFVDSINIFDCSLYGVIEECSGSVGRVLDLGSKG